MEIASENRLQPHPICLTVGALSLLICLVLVQRWEGILVLSSLLIITFVFLRIRVLTVIAGVLKVWPFLLFTALIHLFLSSHNTVTFNNLLPVNLNLEGARLALFFVIRLILILAVGISMFQVYPPQQYGRSVGIWLAKLPFGRSIFSQIELVITLALRFVPFLEQEFVRLKLALKARGVETHPGFRHRLHYLRSILFTLILNAFRRAEHVALALEARGYNPQVSRTSLTAVAMQPLELLVSLVFVGVCVTSPWI
ncbi:MAG: energy-coupling factor transporter transmembrane component T [Calditrichota bacterium]